MTLPQHVGAALAGGRWLVLAVSLAIACSSAQDLGNGVIAIETRAPVPQTMDFGDTAQFRARALNIDGDSVAADLVWRTPFPDTTIIVDPVTGIITSAFPDVTIRAQAFLGSFASAFDTVRVQARPDTLIMVGPEVQDVAIGILESVELAVRLESDNPDGPVFNRDVIFEIIEPVFADPATRTVELINGALADTVRTAPTGVPAPPVVVRRVGATQPDSAIVAVSAFRRRGTPVPGSGQRFIIRFD